MADDIGSGDDPHTGSAAAPLVSVVIPALDAAAYLRDALESVAQQHWNPLEVIVVDDGSTDGTAEVARGFEAFPVCVLEQVNAGVAAARNAGIHAASGDLVAFLDADDVWLPGKLEAQVTVLTSRPGLVFTYGSIEIADSDATGTGVVVEAPSAERAKSHTLALRPGGFHLAMTGVVWREALLRCEGFDPQLSTSADADLALRLLDAGTAEPTPGVLARYRQHASQMHRDPGVLERDWRRVLGRALPNGGPERRRAEAELRWILAATHYRAGHPAAAARDLVGALVRSPGVVAGRIEERRER